VHIILKELDPEVYRQHQEEEKRQEQRRVQQQEAERMAALVCSGLIDP
jgi:hypothetical protein